MICVLTCTGGRQELLGLCRRWIYRQTVQPDIWVVRDDLGHGSGISSAWEALDAGLTMVPDGHHVVVMEDDDWYDKGHIEAVIPWLDRGFEAAGVLTEIRYNIPARRWVQVSKKFPNQGCMAIAAGAIGKFREFFREGPEIPWQRMLCKTLDAPMRVNIKGAGFGLPGRPGATSMHDPASAKVQSWEKDDDSSKLIDLLGRDDAGCYLGLVQYVERER